MRPFLFFSTFFSLFSAAALVAADYTETITNEDKRLSFVGNTWRNMTFPGGTFSYIRRESGSASLTVSNASKIAVTLMVQDPGQTVKITLDNKDNDVFPSSAQEPAWASNLDPSVRHTIVVTKQNPDEKYTALYSFLVTYPGSPASTTNTAQLVPSQSSANTPLTASGLATPNSSESSSPPPTPSALSTQQSNTGPVLTGAKLAGVIVACITVPAVILGIILYRRMMVSKRKAASTAYWEYITARAQQPPGQQPPGPRPPPTPADERFNGAEAKEVP